MIDIKTELVATLIGATSWNVYYELLYKPGTLPAITYIELDNADLLNGDSIDYSTLRYQIKIWSKNMVDIILKQASIDAAMKLAGWKRYAAIETNDGTTIVKVLRYVAIGYNEVN